MIVVNFSKAPCFVGKKIVNLYKLALQHLGQTEVKFELNVSFVNQQQIRQINNQTRQIDRETDVLSYPTVNNESRAILTSKDFCGLINPQNNACMLGDVVICTAVAKRQAKEYGHSFKREVCFLALHGLLHLLGYDHIEPEDEKQMTQLQKEILDQFGVQRD